MRLRTLNGGILAIALGAVSLLGTGTTSARDDADEKKAKQKQEKQQQDQDQKAKQKQAKQRQQEQKQGQQQELQQDKQQRDQERQVKEQQRDQYLQKQHQQKQQETQQWEQERQVKEQRRQGQETQQRLSKERQQLLIDEHRGHVMQYGQRLDDQERIGRDRAEKLHRAKRDANYRYQQRYLDRLREQRLYLARDYDYDGDPYFYTPPSYRYSRQGRYYEVNEYAVDMLQRAVKYGYTEGVLVGQADREDGWGRDYRDSWAYQDANYGYTGYYTSQSEYNYYFREGFRRGYSDGLHGRYEYGSGSNDSFAIHDDVLSLIISLEPLR
jgi:hypothetical protein